MHVRVIYKIVFFWLLLMGLAALFGNVSVAATDGGRTAADFLRIGIGARSAGMAGAYSAVSRGAEASYWNPAGLAGLEGGEIVLGHFSWYQDLNLEHGSAAFSLNDRTSMGLSIAYLNYGTVAGYDVDGNPTGDLAAYDWSGALSVGAMVTDQISVGITGKYINQRLDEVTGSAFAADLGVRLQTSHFAVAVVARNIGSDMTFESTREKLPTEVSVGIAAAPFTERLLASLEVEKKIYSAPVVRQGIEVNFNHEYFLRTGYDVLTQNDGDGLQAGLSFGAGIHLSQFAFDYAYTLQDKYGSDDIHRFSLGLRF